MLSNTHIYNLKAYNQWIPTTIFSTQVMRQTSKEAAFFVFTNNFHTVFPSQVWYTMSLILKVIWSLSCFINLVLLRTIMNIWNNHFHSIGTYEQDWPHVGDCVYYYEDIKAYCITYCTFGFSWIFYDYNCMRACAHTHTLQEFCTSSTHKA